jgi:signal transduction histidine kinase
VLRVGDDVVGRVWFYRDVTARVRADAVILESQQRNKAIIEAIPDLIARIDVSGTLLDLKMPESGPLSQLFPKDDSANLAAFFPRDFVEEAIRHVETALGSGDLVAYECELELQGNLRDLEIRLTPSGPGEALLMARDVTERKKTERELVQRNHELDSFVYRASHDLKAPLNSLMGLIEILKSESKDPELATYLHLMDKSVIKLDTFIRNLTEFSKIARLEIRNQGVDFNELIAEVGEGLKYMEHADRVTQKIELVPGPAFIGDSFHIGIVLGNLLSNAVKYQDLKKPDAWVKVSVKTSPQDCHITVEDNGLGIAAAHQGRIFELFYRASNQSFGSGLGLYITRNAVEKMKGTIEMFSEEGLGTKFVVCLPNLNIAVDKG